MNYNSKLDDITQLSSSASAVHDDDDENHDSSNHRESNRNKNYHERYDVNDDIILPQHNQKEQSYEIPTTNDAAASNNNDDDDDDDAYYDMETTSTTMGTTAHQHPYDVRLNSILHETERTIHNINNNNNENNTHPYHYYTSWISSIALGIGLFMYLRRKNEPPELIISPPNEKNDDDEGEYYYNESINEKESTITKITSFLQSSRVYTWMERMYDEIIFFIHYLYMQYQVVTEYIFHSSFRYWIWSYDDSTSATASPFLRQQRLDYYDRRRHTNHHNNSLFPDSPTFLPDLVEGTGMDDDDDNHAANEIIDNGATTTTTITKGSMVGESSSSLSLRTPSVDRMAVHPHQPKVPIPSRKQHHHYEELEPAFVSDKDYPLNWMVYHPILQRVILKRQADQYNRTILHNPSSTYQNIRNNEIEHPGNLSETNMTRSIAQHSINGNAKNGSLSNDTAKSNEATTASTHLTNRDNTTSTTTTNLPVVRQSVMAT
jgi:hypothetical protein